MSDIDDKLREILANLIKDYDRARKQSAYWTIEPENSIDQIHQAFAKAHYFKLEGERYLMDGEVLPLYSGHEYYKQFVIETRQIVAKYGDDDRFRNIYTEVLTAARRAAGLETEGRG